MDETINHRIDNKDLIKVEKTMEVLGRIGSDYAAESLSEMIGRKIVSKMTKTHLLKINEIALYLRNGGKPLVSVCMQIQNKDGFLLMLFDKDSAEKLLKILIQKDTSIDKWNDDDKSVINEIGNICVCSYLNALAQFLRITLQPTPPSFSFDNIDNIFKREYTKLNSDTKEVFIIESMFAEDRKEIHGKFILVPDTITKNEIFTQFDLIEKNQKDML